MNSNAACRLIGYGRKASERGGKEKEEESEEGLGNRGVGP